MKALLMMLLLSKTLLLTPIPIDLSNTWTELTPKKPLKAITGGAGIYIDVTALVSKDTSAEELQKYFPSGSIVARLVDKKGYEFLMVNEQAYSTSDEEIRLILLNDSPTPTDKKFVKVFIKSKKPFSNVKIIWKNGKL